MNRYDRVALLLFLALLVAPSLLALVLALTVPARPVSGSMPRILAPRAGDEVGPDFSVSGTGGSSSGTTVTVSGEFTGTGSSSSFPDWSVPFNAGTATGDHTATATASLSGVTFTIVGSQSLVLALPTVSASLGGMDVTVMGTHNLLAGPPPAVTVRLVQPDGSEYASKPASDMGGGNWSATFNTVAAGPYAAQASLTTAAGKTVATSRFVRVP